MKVNPWNQPWMLILTGICLLISWLLSYNQSITSLESGFYLQLLELAPAYYLGSDVPKLYLPSGLQHLVLLSVFGLILLHQLWFKYQRPSMFFVILVMAALLISQLLFAVVMQLWLPAIWAIFSFVFTCLVLMLYSLFPRIKQFLFPSNTCQVKTVQRYISENDYNTAVLILKNCPFSDEMFELSYELGIKLEQEKNWSLAHQLYSRLVQFDPGMQGFVERIEHIMSQTMDQDLSLTDITETRSQFGHFKLMGKKAKGATATVYEAHDLNTHQHVALKVLNQAIKDDTGGRDIMSFLHEAMTVSQLEHPNIVRIHDADIIDDHAYIAMEYISGYPMSERLRRKKLLSAAESLRIMRCVLQALVKAHQKGIVHGDLKPANIMYDRQRKNYILTDFGAAYSSKRDLLAEQKIIGTPAYMSPEQLSGGKMDGRSDLYSLAVTIYHLLTGVQPFIGETLPELKNNILLHDVDMDVLTVPDSIKKVLHKALQKKPYLRFADASQMLHSIHYCEQSLTGSNQ